MASLNSYKIPWGGVLLLSPFYWGENRGLEKNWWLNVELVSFWSCGASHDVAQLRMGPGCTRLKLSVCPPWGAFDYGYLVHVRMCVGVFGRAVPCCSSPQQQWPGLCDSLAPGGQSPLCHRAWVNSRSPPAHALVTEFRRLNSPGLSRLTAVGPGVAAFVGAGWFSLFQKWLRLWYYLDSFRRHPPWIRCYWLI